MLSSENKDGLSEKFWAFVGAALAAAPSALEALWNAYLEVPHVPLSGLHLVEIVIVAVTASGAFIVSRVSRGKSGRVKALVEDIRARTAIRR